MARTTLATATILAAAIALAGSRPAIAQAGDHSSHAAHAGMTRGPSGTPTLGGQDAFAAMAEVVRLLEADSTTDWSKVSLERLRAHLISMHDVTLRSTVTQTAVPGGARMEVTGEGRVAASIRTMLRAHAPELEAMGYRATAVDIPGGARLTVTTADSSDARGAAKIRALGFIGLLTLGEHHAAHHLAIARGTAGHAH